MRATFVIFCATAAVLVLGCAPAEQAPPTPQPTPAVSEAEKITDMDFESGEVEGELQVGEEEADQPE